MCKKKQLVFLSVADQFYWKNILFIKEKRAESCCNYKVPYVRLEMSQLRSQKKIQTGAESVKYCASTKVATQTKQFQQKAKHSQSTESESDCKNKNPINWTYNNKRLFHIHPWRWKAQCESRAPTEHNNNNTNDIDIDIDIGNN